MESKGLEIEGQSFEFVKQRVYDPVRIYKGDKTFLRIGPVETIHRHVGLHKKLLGYGFPVPKIVKEGNHNGEAFYVEESLGTSVIANHLMADWKNSGTVSKESFSKLLNVTKRFAEAQLSSAKPGVIDDQFYRGIHMDCIFEERPDLESQMTEAYSKMKKSFSAFPIVITHGDFNPFNFLPEGVIDIEGAFDGPAGYDVITGIYHGYLFPKGGDYEIGRAFEFGDEQIGEYLKMIDDVYTKRGLPAPSTMQDDFMLARTIFYATRMHVIPKVQKYGYKLLEKVSSNYLNGEPVVETIKSFRQ